MRILFKRHSWIRRWCVFNCVGLMGIGIQMTTLLVLTSASRLSYLPATALSVEAAILHNFWWHERWTWADRIAGRNNGRLLRLISFHLTNGALSMTGNLILMRFFVGEVGLSLFHANAIAIAVCAILNYMAGDRIVFHVPEPSNQKEISTRVHKSSRGMIYLFFLPVLAFLMGTPPARAAGIRPETLKAWHAYVEATERRITCELASSDGFLALDFQNPAEAARERQALFHGDIPVMALQTRGFDDRKIPIPEGMIHHWRGSVLIPGVTLDFILSRISNPRPEDTRQEDVLDSRVLEKTPGQLRLFLKLQRSKIVTVMYNTEHLVRYRRHGPGKASSSSIATKIAELERLPGGGEREKPPGGDSGFLWRMNSYWRYQQVSGGVIVECESITLSRSIPHLLEYMVRPIIRRVARESMQRTLQSMRARMTQSYGLQAGVLQAQAEMH
jgi:putative flippase GtrA